MEEESIKEIFTSLNALRRALVQLGPKRRHGNNYENKIAEVKKLFTEYESLLETLPEDISDDIIALCGLIDKIRGVRDGVTKTLQACSDH